MAKESWYINESELDDYQVRIVRRSLNNSFIVKGCAGSGKTVLALWRAKELSEQGNQDYLIIVFTKALKQFIEDGIKTIGVDGTKVLYHWEWKNIHNSKSADYIIVDEVQDFDLDELRELQIAARKHLILFGDSAQQLYTNIPNKGKMLTMEEIQVETKIPMENLVINHRLPKKIARIAEKVSLSNDPLEDRCNKEGVNKPNIISCSSFEDQLDYIIDVIRAQNYTDVGILFLTNEEVLDAKKYFVSKKWGVEAKIGYGARSSDLDFKTDNPKLMTYHSAKGLQFEAVFLPMCISNDEKNRNPLYVALTRSYRDLFILYSKNLSEFISRIDNSFFNLHDEKNTPPLSDDLPF
nr:3'-5' exonuclease [uncultured Sphingobacterium sp.]